MRRRGSLSLGAVGTTNTAGLGVSLKAVHSGVIFSVAFPGASTKCSVRPEVQMAAGSTRWLAIGAAATTIKSTQAGLPFKTTSATPFTRARLRLITRTTGAGSGPDTVNGYIVGI